MSGTILVLLALEAAFVLLDLVTGQAPEGTALRHLHRLVALDREGNLPTWFSATQFAGLAGVLGLAYRLDRRRTWLALSLGALYLSADEAAEIHEFLGTSLALWMESHPHGALAHWLGDYPSYYWALIYAPLFLPAGVVVGIFLWKRLGAYRGLPILGMILYLSGALGLDFLQGRRLVPPGAAVLEEWLEMVGVTLILAACLGHVRDLAPR